MPPGSEDPKKKAAFLELQAKEGASKVALKKTIYFSCPYEGSEDRGGSWTQSKANIINSYMYK